MELFKPRDLGNWSAMQFTFLSSEVQFALADWFWTFRVLSWQKEGGYQFHYAFPSLRSYFFDSFYRPEERYDSDIATPHEYGCSIKADRRARRMRKEFVGQHFSKVPRLVNADQDRGWATITEDETETYAVDAHRTEIFHNAIKKMTNQTPQTQNNLTTDELYVLAIIRPNIMTSENYASTFICDNDVFFTYEQIDPSKKVMLSNVNGWKAFYTELFPGCTVSVEKGIYKTEEVRSLRFVVMSAERKLVLVWLVAGDTYSLHYKNLKDVEGLAKYMQTLHVPKKRTIIRCYSGGDKLITSAVTVDGKYQIHDEFYPMVEHVGGMNAVLDGFKKSTSNLMILAGQWGGGKSALFQALCYGDENEANKYYLIDDPAVYSDSALFSSLISKIETNTREGVTSYLFLEEADDYIRSKKNNPFLSRLAALTAGAAPLKLKIMTATNDSSESEIDSALTRGGRLYAMIKFGLLTPEQANTSRAVLDLKPREFDKNVTLAEALTEAPIITGAGTTKSNRVAVGFAP